MSSSHWLAIHNRSVTTSEPFLLAVQNRPTTLNLNSRRELCGTRLDLPPLSPPTHDRLEEAKEPQRGARPTRPPRLDPVSARGPRPPKRRREDGARRRRGGDQIQSGRPLGATHPLGLAAVPVLPRRRRRRRWWWWWWRRGRGRRHRVCRAHRALSVDVRRDGSPARARPRDGTSRGRPGGDGAHAARLGQHGARIGRDAARASVRDGARQARGRFRLVWTRGVGSLDRSSSARRDQGQRPRTTSTHTRWND